MSLRGFHPAHFIVTLLVWLGFILSACATTQMAPITESNSAKNVEPPANTAIVYLYRPELFGAAVKLDVDVNDESIGYTVSQSFFLIELPPGIVKIESHAENTARLQFSVKAGKIYYVFQEVLMGLMFARNSLRLVDELEGKKGVAESRLIRYVRVATEDSMIAQPQSPAPSVRPVPPRPAERDLVAVIEFESTGVAPEQAAVITDRIREELFKTDWFTIVDRSQMEAILDEQALQQTGCTSTECAIQVGQILGVRRIVAGKVTHISKDLWVVSVIMVDVATSEVMMADSVHYQGQFLELIDRPMAQLAHKLLFAKSRQ